MGRHRFEDQFKEKLGQRKITPSAGSWEKLSGKLNSEEKKGKSLIWWIGIAATFMGAISISGWVYNIDYLPDTPVIVETPAGAEIEDNIVSSKKQEFAAEKIDEKVAPAQEDNSTPSKLKDPGYIKQLQKSSLLAEVKAENLSGSNENRLIQNNERFSQKLDEIIAEVSLIESNAENSTTVDEIDALLYKAAGEISREDKNKFTSGRVDAADLLFAVEMELEESFREKVFDLLKEGYLKARTAVANRSYP